MTEAEWLTSDDPTLMLESIKWRASDRKLRLWTVMCCRKFWRLFNSPAHQHAVDVAERFADGAASEDELLAANRACTEGRPRGDIVTMFVTLAASQVTTSCMADTILVGYPILAAASYATPDEGTDEPRYAVLLRDIFGNPFRPVTLPLAFLSSTALSIAAGIYDDKAFDRLPIVADALQDAGCEDADVLGHLRGGGPHVKGCWALDLVLGKG